MDKIAKRLVIASSIVAILSGLSIISLIAVIFAPKLTERFFLSEYERRQQNSGCRTLSYSTFLEMVKADGVSRVVISPDRGSAQIVEVDGRRAMVQLYPDKDLLKVLTDHDVDIAVKPSH